MFNLFKKPAPAPAPVQGEVIPAAHTHRAVDTPTGNTLVTGTYEACAAYVQAFGMSHVDAL